MIGVGSLNKAFVVFIAAAMAGCASSHNTGDSGADVGSDTMVADAAPLEDALVDGWDAGAFDSSVMDTRPAPDAGCASGSRV